MASKQQVEQRRKAGRSSGAARRKSANPGAPGHAPAIVAFDDTDVEMRSFIAMVGQPMSWPDVKTFAQVRGELYKNRDAATALAVASRSLWTSAHVKERDAAWNTVVDGRLALVERLLDGVSGVNPAQRKGFLDEARAWLLETKRCLSAVHA